MDQFETYKIKKSILTAPTNNELTHNDLHGRTNILMSVGVSKLTADMPMILGD